MTALLRYDAACRALDEAHRVDEVKTIRDQAVAVQAYARQAKDTEMIDMATEIKQRAETRAGELLIDMADRGERAKQGQGKGKGRTVLPLPLSDLGITKTQSWRWQGIARLKAEKPKEWEKMLASARRLAVASIEGDKEYVREARAERAHKKKKHRAKVERDLAGKITALPTRKYGVVYADPEWKFEVWSEGGKDASAENHYPVSELEDIKARDVPSIAADDCVLFLWATVPMLPQALEVMKEWDFTYKSHVVWVKDKAGTGYWFRNKHALLLVGTRGKVPAPAMGTQWESVINAAVGKHSEKPKVVYELIEAYFPTLPKIELNARGPARPGWSQWGLEAEMAEAAE